MTVNTDRIFELAETYAVLATQDPEKYEDLYYHWNTQAEKLEHKGWKKMTGSTQQDKIMKHLENAGSITVREAIVEYSIQSLTKQISELRRMGNEIISTVKFHPITGQKYVRYTLGE